MVVRGKKGVSGRFEIGEWGGEGLKVKDGYIQRSANPPLFEKPECFYAWLKKKNPKLIQTNNP